MQPHGPVIVPPEAHIAESPPAPMGRNVLFVTGGRVSLVAVWFAATMLMARVLGQFNFGFYTLCTRAIGIITGCFGDPLDMAVMRQAPLYLRSDRPRAVEIIRSAFWLRACLGIISIAVTAAVPWLISTVVFGSRNLHNLAMLTALGILGDLLLRSALGYFQVSERFAAFMVIDCIWQLGRAAAVVIFVVFNMLRVETAVFIYIALPYIAFVVATVVLPSDVMRFRLPNRRHVADILHYSKWMVAATMMAAVYERLDVFLLNWFHGAAAVGVYGAAMMFAMIPDFVDGGIQTVLGPKVAPAHARGDFPALQRAYLTYSIPMGVLAAAAAMLVGGPVIRTFLSVKFAASVAPFKILVLSTLFNIIFTPLPAALLSFVAPQKVAMLTLAGLLMVTFGGLAIIPAYGVVGAAAVILITRVVIGTLIVLMARNITGPLARMS
jgi:O-antigen/teichoic acid export membrane protein